MTSKDSDPVVVVGSGPSGLMQALHLARNCGRRVIVIEQLQRNGGMFVSAKTPWGLVDQGVHLLQETGVPEFDDLLFEALPQDRWHIYDGAQKDIAGNFFRGRLDQGSLYPDLRRLEAADHSRILAELMTCAAGQPASMASAGTLRVYLETRFGPHATETVFRPLAMKFWGHALEDLSPWAAKVVHLSRVVVHDAGETLRLKSDPALDAVLGFPEQMAFPERFRTNRRRALYPRSFGLSHVVDGLCGALDQHGVERINGAAVADLEVANGRVTALGLTLAGSARRIPASAVVWTSAPQTLLPLLGRRVPAAMDAPVPHRVIHLFFDAPPATGALYWLWSYDMANALVRVSNPSAYCPDAGRAGAYPVCVEMHVGTATVDDATAIDRAESELRMAGLVPSGARRIGGAVLPGHRGFPVPTLRNCAAIRAQWQAVEDAQLTNLALSTQDLSTGLFYLADILAASKRIIDALP